MPEQAAPISIFNTRTRAKETLAPLEPGHVKLYVCGITAYDYCHLGHARSVLVFDMVVRHLRHRGYKVTFVRNFTDIDDKIINRAQKLGEDPAALAGRFIHEFHTDMDALGALRPDIEPRATDHIPEMLALIRELEARGLAYAAGGDVFFRVARYQDYGALSGRGLDDMMAGARVEVNENKENPMDFVLWKAAKPGEPQWDSPWGPGRPGWHIECAAMSRKYLGEDFDMHGGGKDLVFPHHENEMAQSCGATGRGFARLWMHHGFVTIREEKMAKSLGNFLTIRDVLKKWHPEVLRLFIFSAHYRSPLDFNEQALRDAQSGLSRLYACVERLEALADGKRDHAAAPVSEETARLAGLTARFDEAMDNDFNPAQAIAQLIEAAKLAHHVLDSPGAEPGPETVAALRQTARDMRELGGILGILQQPNWAAVEQGAGGKEARLAGLGLSEEAIAAKIAERAAARKAKNWALSDAIRDELLKQGITLKDSPQGTTWAFQDQEEQA